MGKAPKQKKAELPRAYGTRRRADMKDTSEGTENVNENATEETSDDLTEDPFQ